MAELGPCKRDARETPLCGSGKGAARVIRDTMSPDKKFALAWRDPDKDANDVIEDDADLELLATDQTHAPLRCSIGFSG
jgi:hypothetical protein